MSNYPPGTWHGDPRAPWNQPEAEDVVCRNCEADGQAPGEDCTNCGHYIPTALDEAEAEAFDIAESARQEGTDGHL